MWWVPYFLRHRDCIIAAVNSRVARISHKYGAEIPQTVAKAMRLDKKNRNMLWQDAINKEMENLKVAFDIIHNKGRKLPATYTKASGHMVFDVRMMLEQKAHWVKDDNRTPEPGWSTYAGVISRESVWIALTYALLMSRDVCACNIQNVYLQAPSTEKHCIICGPEFGLENVGKYAIIVKVLYIGKSAGANYWQHVRKAMEEMDFKSCTASSDIWLWASTKSDGTSYYQYALLYTDYILAIMEDLKCFEMEELGKRFTIKEKLIGPPVQYLGGKVSKVELNFGTK